MRREERLFLAIGAADPELLLRSRRERKNAPGLWRMGLAAAACLAVVCTLAVSALRKPAPPMKEEPPLATESPGAAETPAVPELRLPEGGEPGELHLASLRWEAEGDGAAGGFLLYINRELYSGAWEGEDYVVRPNQPLPEGMPECSLTVSHRSGVTLEAALLETRRALEAAFDMVEEQPSLEGRAALSAWMGDASGASWDAANADLTLVDDRQGGVFLLTARYFTEAAEGHGSRFADMASAFRPLPGDAAAPAWMASLRETVDVLLPAAFSGDWTPEAKSLLAEGAWAELYGEDVSGYVSISGVDVTTDGGQDPDSAVVSVRHRLSAEESMAYVTMELRRTGDRWLAEFIGLEK